GRPWRYNDSSLCDAAGTANPDPTIAHELGPVRVSGSTGAQWHQRRCGALLCRPVTARRCPVDAGGPTVKKGVNSMADSDAALKHALKALIIEECDKDELTPDDISDDQPLVGGDLELDSLDVLQIC